jgi:hypothetical protein
MGQFAWLAATEAGALMKDMQAHLEKLRTQIAECEMIRDLATERRKQELFARLAEHFRVLADEIQKTIEVTIPKLPLDRKTQGPSSDEKD